MTRERTVWHVTNSNGLFEVTDEDGVKVAYIAAGEDAFSRARLVASAPDLLAALKAVRENLIRLAWEENSLMIESIDNAISRAESTALSGQT